MSKSSKTAEVLKVFAFASPEGGGNAAGVRLDADALTPEQMQAIAADVGLSETAFVSKSKAAGFKLDFFTPNKRIPDCGHATVAAFSVLARRQPELRETSKETVAGVRKIFVEGEKIFMEQPIPTIVRLPAIEALAFRLFGSALGVRDAWLSRHDVGFVIFELENEAQLKAITPNLPAVKSYSEEQDLVGAYLFVKKHDGRLVATTRMFAPAYGIDEESATGMAAGLLAPLLDPSGAHAELVIEQGRHMAPPSPSLIFCRVRPRENRILVGGSARIQPHQA